MQAYSSELGCDKVGGRSNDFMMSISVVVGDVRLRMAKSRFSRETSPMDLLVLKTVIMHLTRTYQCIINRRTSVEWLTVKPPIIRF